MSIRACEVQTSQYAHPLLAPHRTFNTSAITLTEKFLGFYHLDLHPGAFKNDDPDQTDLTPKVYFTVISCRRSIDPVSAVPIIIEDNFQSSLCGPFEEGYTLTTRRTIECTDALYKGHRVMVT